MTQDAMGHPSLDGSLLIALSLYAALAGHRAESADIVVTAALLPPAAAVSAHSLTSGQPQLAGGGRETKATAGRLRALQP